MEKENNKNIEREYIIPLRHRWQIVPRYQRTNKAVKTVKEFLVRHMKIRDRDLDKIKLDKHLNELLWSRGIKNPLSKVKVKAVKEGDIVRVEAVELPANIKFKKIRAEKVKESAKEVAKKRKSEKAEAAEEVKAQAVETKEEDKKEVEEKKESTIIAEEKIEKAAAKTEKHTTKVQTPKQEKMQTKSYDSSSRGH